MPGEAITSFSGANRFLSNFYTSAVTLDGGTYPTVEHAYQAAKTRDRSQRAWIADLMTPSAAKKAGRRVTLRPDWEDVKLTVMKGLLEQKFSSDPLRGMLVDTHPAELVEGNPWGDVYWGVCDGRGTNWLGRLLMDIRSHVMMREE